MGDFCFFAGRPNTELVRNISRNDSSDFLLMIPQNEGWSKLIEQAYSNNCKKTLRYAIKKEPGIFDRKRLEDYAGSIPQGYHIKAIDEALYHQTKGEDWSRDF